MDVKNLNLNLLTVYFNLDSGGISSSSNHNNILLQSGVSLPHQLNDLLIRSCHTKSLSSLHTPLELNPWFITGFTDGEGSFSLSVRYIDKNTKKGKILYVFSIVLHKKDEGILRSIQSTPLLSYNSIMKRGLLKFKQTSCRKFYSSTSFNRALLSDEEFYEWLRGLIDGEGCFYIKKNLSRKNSPFTFLFLMNLHIDDKVALDYIQMRLNIGKVHVIKHGKMGSLIVEKKTEIKFLMEILSKVPLNTTKRLNFEDWKQAFELYFGVDNISDRGETILEKIDEIKKGMNTRRHYETSKLEFHISKYWLLGFIEGEGSFSISKNRLHQIFYLGQVSSERPLLEKIKEFLESYNEGKISYSTNNKPIFAIYDKPEDAFHNRKPFSSLRSANQEFFLNVLVPLLSPLSWQTKKYKDFKDWSAILEIKAAGLHLSPKGKEVIQKVISQMNNYRLSTNPNKINIDRNLLYSEIADLLAQPSIKGVAKRPVNLLNERGELFKSFPSIYSCAKFLGISKYKVNTAIELKKALIYNEKLYFVREE